MLSFANYRSLSPGYQGDIQASFWMERISVSVMLSHAKVFYRHSLCTQKKQSSEIRTAQETILYPREQNSKVSRFSHQITQANSKGITLKGLLSVQWERVGFYKPNIMCSFIKAGNRARPDGVHSIWPLRNVSFTAEPPH